MAWWPPFYDLKVYNIGAGSQKYNTSIQYTAGSRIRLIPYCCYKTKRLKDEDLKNLIKSITWVNEKDFEVVDLTEDSYYDWINACLLKYFDDFKVEENAAIVKLNFLDHVHGKVYHLPFLRSFPRIGNKKSP